MQACRVVQSEVLTLADGRAPRKKLELFLYGCLDGVFRVAAWNGLALLPSLRDASGVDMGLARDRGLGEAAFEMHVAVAESIGYERSTELPLFLCLPYLGDERLAGEPFRVERWWRDGDSVAIEVGCFKVNLGGCAVGVRLALADSLRGAHWRAGFMGLFDPCWQWGRAYGRQLAALGYRAVTRPRAVQGGQALLRNAR